MCLYIYIYIYKSLMRIRYTNDPKFYGMFYFALEPFFGSNVTQFILLEKVTTKLKTLIRVGV